VREATRALTGKDPLESDVRTEEALRECALQIVDDIAIQLIRVGLNDQAVSSLRVGSAADSASAAQELSASLQASATRLSELSAAHNTVKIQTLLEEERARLTEACSTDAWIADFPGRNVLKRYVRDHVKVKYEAFVNIVLDRMAEANFQPPGMKRVLDEILDA